MLCTDQKPYTRVFYSVVVYAFSSVLVYKSEAKMKRRTLLVDILNNDIRALLSIIFSILYIFCECEHCLCYKCLVKNAISLVKDLLIGSKSHLKTCYTINFPLLA